MTEQLPDDQMQLLVADAVRYRFLRDLFPAIINEICETNPNFDLNNYDGFVFNAYARKDGKNVAVYGNDMDDAIDAEIGILFDREIAEQIKETP